MEYIHSLRKVPLNPIKKAPVKAADDGNLSLIMVINLLNNITKSF